MDPEPSQQGAPVEAAATSTGFTLHDYLNPTERRRLRRLPALLRLAVTIVWKAAPRELVASAVLQLVSAGALAGQLLFLRELLSELLPGDPRFGDVAPEVVGLAVLGAAVALVSVVVDSQQRVLGTLVAMHTADELIAAAVSVDLVTYDSPVFHDRLQRAQLSSAVRPTQLANGLIGVLGALFGIAGVGAALLVVQPLFFALVLLTFVPAWFATNRASRLSYRFSVEQTERERRRTYLYNVLTRKDEAQEVRGFDLGRFLGRRHRELYEAMLADLRVVLRRRLWIALVGQLASAALAAGSIGLLVWLVTTERVSLSEAGSAAGGMVLLSGRLRSLAGSTAGLYEGALYLDDYASFVAVTPQLAAARPRRPAPERLDLVAADGVRFTYPNRAEPALVDVSIELRRGEVVALVGENGSGKTTFAKLLAGLYLPAAGAVTWDGVDTASLEPASMAARVAPIFQDFVRWQLSAHDNVALGDHARADDAHGVGQATRATGVHDALAALPAGYDTLLGPQFYGGSTLSGGEWQRIALARAMFRDAPLVILDEPSASLDPRAEAALYESMGDLFRDRSVLLISHRFGSVRAADRIYVLAAGRVVEHGTHDELMALDGLYAELFRLQSRWYVD